MKKLFFLLFLLPVLASAQSRHETSAKATISTMTEVLKLSAPVADEAYKIELKKNEDLGAIRAAGGDDVRVKVVARVKTYEADLEKLIGKEQVTKWNAYVKEQKAKK